jgi:crossover junction endodeoxyribonuclease RuvC
MALNKTQGSGEVAYVIGIDPGSRVLGYAVLEQGSEGCRYIEAGVLKPPEGDLADRLLVLGQDLESLFRDYPPAWVALEKIFLGKNIQSAFVLGHVRGLVLHAARRAGAQVAEYAPRSMKKGITGYGEASKGQVQGALMAMLGLKGAIPLDASDALGLGFHLGLDKKLWTVGKENHLEGL